MAVKEAERSIYGVAKSVEDVLSNKQYKIDYYQREYKWESKQLGELVADLTSRFAQLFDEVHARRDVAKYPGYYLGSIIVSQKGTDAFIVDGQQRLTTLTLLLTYLRSLQSGRADSSKVDDLIYSESFGEMAFNLDVDDRNACMQALFDEGHFEPPADASDSVRNLVARFAELDDLFPEDLKGQALPYFVDWLKKRVQIVEITAFNDDDAYAIFETMNDRGLKLTPADMLKGYLLANIADGEPRVLASDLWRRRMRELDELADGGGADFLKTWLRSQYAMKIRERKRDARPQDWDRIGTEFHRWLRNDRKAVGLTTEASYSKFVLKDLDFYAEQYSAIVRASTTAIESSSPLRFIRYNADLRFTLQDQVLLSPLRLDDDRATIERKLEIVGRFVDILLAWRIWNYRSTDYSTMQYAMFTVMRDIRGMDVADLARHLHEYLTEVDEDFDTRPDLGVHQQNRNQLHKILARITDYVSVQAGRSSNYVELVGLHGVKYEVEHIWANRPERHASDFEHEYDFARHRNLIGDLLLLPKSFNASFGDDSFEEKVPRYFGQNLLAASLSPQAYERDPGFAAFVQRSGLEFRSYDRFDADSVVERGELYREIAKHVWNPSDVLALGAGR